MQRLLITGSNGFVGQKLQAALRGNADFLLLPLSRNPERAGVPTNSSFTQLDITDQTEVALYFEKHRPDIVIHTAAMSLPDPCEKNPEECWKINVLGTEHLVEAAERYGSHFIHLSTDFVFDGTQGPYQEEDTPHPLSLYGKSKHASEQVVMKSKTPWAIARTVLVYGILPVMPQPNILTFVKSNLEKGEKIRVVSDQFRTPTFAEDLAEGCLKIARLKTEGIFHLSGNEMISVYDFAKKIAAVFELDDSLIEPVLTASLNEAAKRPPRTGFILEKARKVLGYSPHSLQEGLEIVRRQIAEIEIL